MDGNALWTLQKVRKRCDRIAYVRAGDEKQKEMSIAAAITLNNFFLKILDTE